MIFLSYDFKFNAYLKVFAIVFAYALPAQTFYFDWKMAKLKIKFHEAMRLIANQKIQKAEL